jgi:hypothetical protein
MANPCPAAIVIVTTLVASEDDVIVFDASISRKGN